jgi:AcrR family transcriptional regulator
VTSQGERRAQTRRALLDAAATLFAERGVDGASIDAIAAAADRTSGAIYDHFGGKEGLLFALLEGWVDDVAAVIGAELTTARSLDAQLAAIWRNVTDPVTGDGRWIALEHELWAYAARRPHARAHLAARYEAAWAGIESAEWVGGDAGGPGTGPALIALLLGLEMMRRVSPDAVSDDLAVASLRAVVTASTKEVRR